MWRSLVDADSVAGDLLRRIGQTFATRLVLIIVSLLSSVIIARTLGPSGRGAYGVASVVAMIGAQVSMLGLHAANTYQLAKDPARLPVLLGNSLAISLLAGSVCAVVVVLWFGGAGPHRSLEGVLLWLAALGIPLFAAFGLLQNLYLGLYDTARFNRVDLLSNGANLGLLIVLVLVGVESAVTVYGASLVVAAGIGASMIAWLYRKGGSIGLSVRRFRTHLGFSLRSYVSMLLMLLALRIDLLLVDHYRGAEAAGHFAIAATLAELLGMLAVVTGSILFPRLSSESDAAVRWHLASRTAFWIAVAVGFAGLLSLPLAAPVLVTLFGDQFAASVVPYHWLVPGAVCLSINAILMNYFASEGMPPVVIVGPLIALLTKLALAPVLIADHGVAGAAIAASVSYGGMFLTSLVYLFWTRRAEYAVP
ncbi:MAG: oligosaccharide flippase family protein [Gammaproteobacteria bacterium]|nr:oligosaccharide flippase family protein [Gammaproteobacteria bacterium]